MTCLASDLSVEQIAAGVRDQHEKFLHLDRGITIKFKLRVEQTKNEEMFLFADGTDGVFSLKWPRLHVLVKGRSSTNGQKIEREGHYDFQTMLGGGRDGLSAQLTPYRHQNTASLVFPLICLYYDESEQKFMPDQPYHSSRGLPSCLESQGYTVSGVERIDDVNCLRVASGDGSDLLWIDPDQGFALRRRQFRDPQTKLLKEQVENHEFTEVAPGVWFPHRQVFEFYNYSFKHTKKTRKFTYRYTVSNEISLGVGEKLETSLPDQTTVQDQRYGITYVKALKLDRAFAAPLKQAAFDIANPTPPHVVRFPWWPVISISSGALLLSIATTLICTRLSRR
jgi:hypothetical protein